MKDPAQVAADGRDGVLDADQTSSGADQTGSDLDQTSSDADQGASERDQRASDRDQHAADIDQAASDRAHAAGSDSDAYERTRRTRSQTARERDLDSQARAEVAHVRETTAARRDEEAEERDSAAEARDRLAATLDAQIDQLEMVVARDGNGGGTLVDTMLQAARARKRAAASRAQAALHRQQAAGDRAAAREDRVQAASDRRAASEGLVAEGIDSLTGTLRRQAGRIAIQREVDRSRRTLEPLVLGFVDVDGLKAVNDIGGHSAGDDLLFGVACCIKLALRPYDVIARYGGDEFICAFAGQDIARARRRFEDISTQIAETQKGATITVGFAEGLPDESLDELIVRADSALIAERAKRQASPV